MELIFSYRTASLLRIGLDVVGELAYTLIRIICLKFTQNTPHRLARIKYLPYWQVSQISCKGAIKA